MTSIPYTPHPGLLYAPGLDLWTWLGYAFVLTLALCFMPGQLRESLIELGRPVMAWFARLSVPWLWEALFIAGSVLGLVAPLRWDNWPEDEDNPEDGYRGVGLAGSGSDP
jgi:hypothetical protein